eukprot:3783769-Rhodomonas_salina.1
MGVPGYPYGLETVTPARLGLGVPVSQTDSESGPAAVLCFLVLLRSAGAVSEGGAAVWAASGEEARGSAHVRARTAPANPPHNSLLQLDDRGSATGRGSGGGVCVGAAVPVRRR